MRQLNEKIDFRAYVEDDFESIHLLNIQEEWNNLVAKKKIQKMHGVIQMLHLLHLPTTV